MGLPWGLGAWTCLCPSLSSAQQRCWPSPAPRALPNRGHEGHPSVGETSGKPGETKPFDFKTKAECSAQSRSVPSSCCVRLVGLTWLYLPPKKERPETWAGAEIPTLCAFLDAISTTLDLNSAYFSNNYLFCTCNQGR